MAPALGGGATAAVRHADRTEEVALRGGRAVEVKREQEQLHVLWEYDLRGQAVRVAWTYRILGKALAVSVRCDELLVSRFSLGDVGLAPLRRTFSVPYLAGHVVYLPANPAFGGDEGMIAFGKAANRCGYIWSLHENYIDLYPDAPSYDPSARVLKADGTPSPAWYNAGTSWITRPASRWPPWRWPR